MSVSVVVKEIVKKVIKSHYLVNDSDGKEIYINGEGRILYTLKIQEPDRNDLTDIEYITRRNLNVNDEIFING